MSDKKDLKERSKQVFQIIKQTPFYYVPLGIMNALGYSERELNSKPLIGIASSWNEVNPGHAHLNWLAEAVKSGVIEAGGIPMLFNTVAPCDGFANGHDGMRHILPQREIVADSVEAMVEAHKMDALVTISSCDKINPGMLMAAARLNIPTICVPGGPNMYEIEFQPDSVYEGIDAQGHYTDFNLMTQCVNCATYGACALMGTANTTQCLMEAFGMTLPNAAATPAMTSMKYRIAKDSGTRAIQMLEEGLKPSTIMTKEALENAIMVDQALGGSTNSTIHLPAIAHEMGIDMDLAWFNELGEKIPMITNVSPSGRFSLVDFYRAGGVPALMSRLKEHLHLDAMTASGKTWKRLLKKVSVRDDNIILPLESPIYPTGGTLILKGNLAPNGAVIKASAVKEKEMLVFTGIAKVFESERDAITALAAKEIKNGTVVVIRNEGPKGAPGMPELLAFTATMMVMKDITKVAMITDGRFSGATAGPMIGHVSPEAFVGGPIAIVQDGDPITIDIPSRKLELGINDNEINARLKKWKPAENSLKNGVLKKYRALVTSADKGCVMKY